MHGVALLLVLASADTSVSAKFGDGVTVRLGDIKLQARGRVQAQARIDVPGEPAFLIRRARLQLKGEFPLHLSFTLQLGFAPLDMEADQLNPLRDLYAGWAPLRDLRFRLGQMKVPFDVQRVVSSSALQFVDRSMVTAELNLDRDVGFVAYSDDFLGWGGRLRYALGLFGGDGRNRHRPGAGLLYVARVRFSPTGEFNDKAEGDVERDRRVRFAVGGAIARNEATMRPRSTTGLPYVLADSLHSYTHAAADVHFKWYGFSLLSQFFWRQADLRVDAAGGLSASRTGLVNGAPVTEYSRSALGYFVQAGGYVVDWLELVARYGELYPLGPTDPELRRQREVGGGFNLMLWKHDLKVACDVFWLDDGRGGDGRVQVRTQLQMYF